MRCAVHRTAGWRERCNRAHSGGESAGEATSACEEAAEATTMTFATMSIGAKVSPPLARCMIALLLVESGHPCALGPRGGMCAGATTGRTIRTVAHVGRWRGSSSAVKWPF